ncbi:aldehyde ferredoxin oxidoreductase family protein [Desulfohalobiaceae bacterium Ax17]|uniref:aldehyde ferredoxin oxidoreductase family protein n=1 Tax=Desulfovulcanus ferrireducens TaxID=2831190 RepID=UPI00207BA5D7|nr:aldehyde ferredoxin oxidoreductase family protein [Desulfovulcanus ferrireducens]MBT8763571.1 aldehyde ferredoxin oxidoreductase family protein [Desulfovulcanus ferrireducens]
MFGFYGRIIVINLDDQSYTFESIPDDILAAHLGGKGLGTYLLLTMNPPGTDPLGPENHLIFTTGPVTQSLIWGGSRYGVFTKSPLTGFYTESYAGGKVPEAMDSIGVDAVVIKGQSKKPTALSIHPDGCTFFDASELWGLDSYKTEDEAKARFSLNKPGYRNPGAVVIGPAGENLVRLAVIENDYWRSAGRTGVGAVMGAKKLKAIVFQGDFRRPLYSSRDLAAYSKKFVSTNKNNPGVKAYKTLGTTMMVAMMNTVGAFPSRYWQQGTCAHWEKISGETYHKEHQVTPHACAKCFMACSRKAKIKSGPHQGLTIEGPEYETIYAFGGLCMIEEMDQIAYLNDLCDRLGLDTITGGNLCAFTIEAVRRGKVKYPIDYGQAQAVADLLKDIAMRRGIGSVLAEGIVFAARTWGLEDLAIHVKGLEPAGYDPRVLKGMGLAYAVADRGACHLRSTFYKPELAGHISPDAVKGKAEMLIDYEDRLTIFDSLILCRFYRDLYSWEELAKLVHLVTGLSVTKEDLKNIAASIADMTRQFNLREGLKPEHDRLPKRLHSEALPDGQSLNKEEFEYMLGEYYKLRGWNSERTD